jgi:hypothetical protein
VNRSLKAAGIVSSACAAAIAALFALPLTSADAAQTTGAALSMNGVQTAQTPSGSGTVVITAGDTVVFSLAKPPSRAEAPLLGYTVTLNPSSFPGSPSAVKLSGTKTYSMTFGSEGSFPFNWTASNTLGRIAPRSGEYTSARIVVNAVPVDPQGGSTPPPGSDPPPTSGDPGSPTGTVGGSGPGLPGVPGTTAPPGFIITTNAAGLPVSVPRFSGPHDSGGTSAGPGAVIGLQGTAGAVPGNGVNASGVAAGAAADPQFVADPHTATPPRALAVMSILSLTVVAAFYAYTYLGRRAGR